ncbi:MAG: hypothetical protein R3F41_11590 [Gammaproteobacteria bacterium]|nr:hypothetical protein [Pseudomonadales bacterium]MCP5348255.1 hypothetical protein [Pseudomonadales bacterium]
MRIAALLTRPLAVGLSLGLTTLLVGVFASQSALAQLSYRSGQHVEPAYEGWRPNDDGSISLVFGYFNENWEETPEIPIGDNNYFSPGARDQGQPTHFLPRRNRFTFEVVVPADFGDEEELVWTLTSPNGVTKKAYATLLPDYKIDDIIIASETGSLGAGTSSPESRANVPPQVEIIGDRVRTVHTGEALHVQARVTDDGIPKPGRVGSTSSLHPKSPEEWKKEVLDPPSRVTVGKVNGLFLSWNKYRGPGEVSFEPPQVKPWEDTRTSANSPWSALWMPPEIPADGIYDVEVSFSEPGQYTLWARADDGGLFQDQFLEVTVLP